MKDGILTAVLLDIKNTYKNDEESHSIETLEKIDQALDCIKLLQDSWHRQDLDKDLAILKKVREAVVNNADKEKFEKFITEAIFM